jgi:RNA polymerase sigma-70 factor (ECF subfamily)
MSSTPPAALDRWAELSDEQVVAQVLAGHTAFFEALMRRHNQRLYRAARAILRDEAEAEDVMQQTYVNAFTHLRQFDGRAQFATWLTRIAVHESLARLRRRGREPGVDPERSVSLRLVAWFGNVLNPERLAFSRELGALLESAIDQLPDGAREVFMLRQVEGMSTEQVAEALDVSIDVVKTRLSRARAALRRELLEHADAAASNAFRFLRPRCDRVVAGVLAVIAAERSAAFPSPRSETPPLSLA